MRGHPIFAAMYDRMLSRAERSGLMGMRAELLQAASGRTLELGAGTGLNLEHYPSAVSELVLTEPDPHMARRLRKRVQAPRASGARTHVIEALAEDLPVESGSVDCVVSTLVLCTVDDPPRVAAEIRRVLRRDGLLLCLEHVRSPESERVARWQDRLERPWGWAAGGCHPNRDSVATLAAAGFDVGPLARDRLPSAPPIVRPLMRGQARLAVG